MSAIHLLRMGINNDLSTDTMENWDEEKLRTVVLSKAGNPRTTTDVCFILSIFYLRSINEMV